MILKKVVSTKSGEDYTNNPDSTIASIPLEKEHLPAHVEINESVWIESISNVKDVNNLSPNQILSFAKTGLTVIYGDNGTGKSGYSRILKNCCRARHREKIISNINKPGNPIPCATIEYGQGTKSTKSINWQSGNKPHNILSAVSVFDRNCALNHLSGKNEVAYKPYGLDIPDKLADVCLQLKKLLEKEVSELEKSKNDIFFNPPWKINTFVGKNISKLSPNSNIEDFKKSSKLSIDESTRLTYLTESLSQDLQKASQEQANKAKNINQLISYIQSLNIAYEEKQINKIVALKNSAVIARKTANLTASNIFANSSLSGIDEDIWKNLWNAAKSYSEKVAYLNVSFPNTEENSLCVLCQQPLSSETKKRLINFNDYIQGETEQVAQTEEDNFLNKLTALPKIKLKPYQTTLEDICLSDKKVHKSIKHLLATIKLRRIMLLYKLNNLEEKVKYPLIDSHILISLKNIREKHQNSSEELIQAQQKENLEALKNEQEELLAKQEANKHIHVISLEIERLKKTDDLKKCIKETITTKITNLGSNIADEIITKKLRDKFSNEVISLIGNRFCIEMKRSSGSYGTPSYKISFSIDPKLDVSKILSEGEQTCVAIATFLAELATTTHNSSLVFDDPISSLDHEWRAKIAERLVNESKNRQVIIFTHDLIFLNDLQYNAEENDIKFSTHYLDRTRNDIGLVNSDLLPWDSTTIKARIDFLLKFACRLKRERTNLPNEKYKEEAGRFYSKLRTSWERALEEIGLANSITRYRKYINAKLVRKISAIELSDCEKWYRNYSECSNHLDGHDNPNACQQEMPEPDKLIHAVESLENWVRDLMEKQKVIKSEDKKFRIIQ